MMTVVSDSSISSASSKDYATNCLSKPGQLEIQVLDNPQEELPQGERAEAMDRGLR